VRIKCGRLEAPAGRHVGFQVFKQLLRDLETDAVKAELKWLTEELGSARELDVLIGDVLVPARKRKMRKEPPAYLIRGRRRTSLQ
jgi:hypothetical protein